MDERPEEADVKKHSTLITREWPSWLTDLLKSGKKLAKGCENCQRLKLKTETIGCVKTIKYPTN